MSEGLLTKLIELHQTHLRIQTYILALMAGLSFHRQPFLDTGNLNPTLSLGAGYTNINDYDHMTTNLGVGLTYMFDQSFGLTLKAKRKIFSRDVSDLIGKIKG